MLFRRPYPDNNYPSTFTVYDMKIGDKKTEIQIIVTTEITERDGMDYIRELLSTFDLDFCRMAIYCDEYYKLSGGKDTIRIFLDDKMRKERGLNRNNAYTKKTEERARKYISRLEYQHFTQFAGGLTLEEMSFPTLLDIVVVNRDPGQPVPHLHAPLVQCEKISSSQE